MKNHRIPPTLLIALTAALLTIVSCAKRSFFKTADSGLPPYNGTVLVLDSLPDSGTYVEVGSFYDGRVAPKKTARTIEIAKRIAAEKGADAIVILENRKKEDMEIILMPSSNGATMMTPMFDSYVVFKAKAIKLTGR